jgi:hypothetical protein
MPPVNPQQLSSDSFCSTPRPVQQEHSHILKRIETLRYHIKVDADNTIVLSKIVHLWKELTNPNVENVAISKCESIMFLKQRLQIAKVRQDALHGLRHMPRVVLIKAEGLAQQGCKTCTLGAIRPHQFLALHGTLR